MSRKIDPAKAQIARDAAEGAPLAVEAEAAGEAAPPPPPARVCSKEGLVRDDAAGLDPDLSDEAWAAKVARREAKLKPAKVKLSPPLPTGRQSPARPGRLGAEPAPDYIEAGAALRAIVRKIPHHLMAQEHHNLMAAAERQLLRALRDPTADIVARIPGQSPPEGAGWDGFVVDDARHAFVGKGGAPIFLIAQMKVLSRPFFAWMERTLQAAAPAEAEKPAEGAPEPAAALAEAQTPAASQGGAGLPKEGQFTLPKKKKKTGPRTGKRDRVTQQMVAEIRAGKYTLDDLDKMPQKGLAAQYGVSRYTACKALDRAAGIVGIPNSGK